jgi:putative ABC transport system substrate-binding protein
MPNHNDVQDRTHHIPVLLMGALLIVLLLSGCSSKPKVYRVGILSSFAPFADIANGFKAKMTELGYIEGKNIVYDLQVKHADPEGERQAVKKFVADKVDLIFTFPTEASVNAKETTKGTKIPVVFALAAVEENNLIESIPHPGGNITGVRYNGPDNTVKRFEILCALAPNIKRLYTIYNVNYPATKASIEALRRVVSSSGIKLTEAPITTVEGIQAELRKRTASGDIGMDAILLMPDDLSQAPAGSALIRKFADKHRIPIGGSTSITADNGAVFSYAPDFIKLGSMAATLADKIFKGTPAGTIPVVTADQTLRLNYKVAKKLGLKVSESMMSLASEIIR